MRETFETFVIILLFSGFGIIHSFLASLEIKKKLAVVIKEKIAFYRIFYNIISLLLFLAVYEMSPKPQIMIYDLPEPYDLWILGLQMISLVFVIAAGFSVNLREFLGIEQIIRYFRNEYDPNELDEKYEFKKTGFYKYTRHPIYFFCILFLGLRPAMDLFYLVFFITMTGYFFAGSYFEERKLAELFGEDYTQYQKDTARIIPFLKFIKGNR